MTRIYDTPEEIATAANQALSDNDADAEQLARTALHLISDLAEILGETNDRLGSRVRALLANHGTERVA